MSSRWARGWKDLCNESVSWFIRSCNEEYTTYPSQGSCFSHAQLHCMPLKDNIKQQVYLDSKFQQSRVSYTRTNRKQLLGAEQSRMHTNSFFNQSFLFFFFQSPGTTSLPSSALDTSQRLDHLQVPRWKITVLFASETFVFNKKTTFPRCTC